MHYRIIVKAKRTGGLSAPNRSKPVRTGFILDSDVPRHTIFHGDMPNSVLKNGDGFPVYTLSRRQVFLLL